MFLNQWRQLRQRPSRATLRFFGYLQHSGTEPNIQADGIGQKRTRVALRPSVPEDFSEFTGFRLRQRDVVAITLSLIIHLLLSIVLPQYIRPKAPKEIPDTTIEIFTAVAEPPPLTKLKKPALPTKRPGKSPRTPERIEEVEPTPQESLNDESQTQDPTLEEVTRVETDAPDTVQPDTPETEYDPSSNPVASNPNLTVAEASFSATDVDSPDVSTITEVPDAVTPPLRRRLPRRTPSPASSRAEVGPLPSDTEPIIPSAPKGTDRKRNEKAGERVGKIMERAGKTKRGNPKGGTGGKGKVMIRDGEGGGGRVPDEIVGWRKFKKLLKDGNEQARFSGGPVRVVFLLDKSGSMNGKKIQLAKSALKDAIQELREEERFYLILFDSHLHNYQSNYVYATEGNKDQAFRYLDGQNAGTGTNISQVFENVFQRQTASLIWFISDGAPSEGVRETVALVSLIKQANKSGTTIHTIGLGRGSNFHGVPLMSGIAGENNGVFRGIDLRGY